MLGKAYYEGKEINFELPQQWNLLVQAEPRGVLGLNDIGGCIREAFKSPIGIPSFSGQLLIDKKITIISDDQTRPTPAEDLLPPLLDQFNELGVMDQDVDLLVGGGLIGCQTM